MKKYLAVLLVALAAAFVLAASAQASSSLRSCGSAKPMAPNHVWATRDVGCSQARLLMRKLLAGSEACYPFGFTQYPSCAVEGFRCSAHPVGPYLSRGACVHHQRRVFGQAGD